MTEYPRRQEVGSKRQEKLLSPVFHLRPPEHPEPGAPGEGANTQ